jgi:hypothetical protein
MPIPWLRLFDTVLYVFDITRPGARRPASREEGIVKDPPARGGWIVERLVEREQKRIEFERERMEVERARADRTLKLDLLRHAGDREIGRLRLTAGIAVTGLIGALLFWAQLVAAAFTAIGTRLLLGSAWTLLVAALALSFAGQKNVAGALARIDEANSMGSVTAGTAGKLAPWLLIGGLALFGIAALAA